MSTCEVEVIKSKTFLSLSFGLGKYCSESNRHKIVQENKLRCIAEAIYRRNGANGECGKGSGFPHLKNAEKR